jgi:hypothetical protein
MSREMELVRGIAMMGAAWDSESTKLFKFLSIFHPEMPLEERLSLARDLALEEARKTEKARKRYKRR